MMVYQYFFPFAAFFTASAIASIRLKALKSRQQIISASDISLSANSFVVIVK